MRRLEFLINEVRESTDNVDTNGIKDSELIGYFNDGIDLIQSLIFKVNPYASIFKGVVEFDANSSGEYELPDDIFAANALSLVEGRFGGLAINDGYSTINMIGERERRYIFGYFLRDNKLIITGQNINLSLEKVRVTYFKKLERFDKRWGQITSFIANTSITLNASTYDSQLRNVDDIISIVDVDGEPILSGVRVAFSGPSNVLGTSNSLVGVAIGQYVVAGAYTSTSTNLPDKCETYLKDYVRQRIYTRNNYNDAGKQVYFTDKQEQDIVSIFSKNSKDVDYIPITDTDYLEI